MAARKFTSLQRQELKQAILETVIQRMPRDQALPYIKERMNGEEISVDYYHHLKSQMRKNTGARIAHYMKDRYAFHQLFFDRVDEIRNLQAEQWRLFRDHTDDPALQHQCLKELHQLTISLGNYYDVLPSLTSTYVQTQASDAQSQSQSQAAAVGAAAAAAAAAEAEEEPVPV